jgi:hypothetical protein
MGKGLSKRHREKRAEKANHGNLHKQAKGKVSGRAFEPLPNAPQDDELKQDVTYMPKSLQKLLKVKAAAESGVRPQRSTAAVQVNQAKEDVKQNDRMVDEPVRIRNEADTRGLEPSSSGQHKGGLFEVKRLKQSKKDYLNKKKLKKKGKGGVKAGTALEESLKQQQRVAFGDSSSHPPEVSLKRKSWTAKEKTQGERCKEVFLKQLNEAQAKASSGPAAENMGGKMSEAEREDLRSKAIEAYRAAKGRNGDRKGGGPLSALSRPW